MHLNFATSYNYEEETRTSPLEDDILVHGLIDKKLLRAEVELFRTKWFDYRHLTPLAATKLYIGEFGRIYRQFYARYLDRQTAQYVRPPTFDSIIAGLKRQDIEAKSNFSAMWRGRMAADMIGMPYELYLNLAFEFRLRYWSRSKMPRPHQLYRAREIEQIAEAWEKYQEGNLYVSQHPAYLVQNDCGAPHQADHRIWLVNQAMKRSDPVELMVRFIESDLLTTDDVAVLQPDLHQRVLEAVA